MTTPSRTLSRRTALAGAAGIATSALVASRLPASAASTPVASPTTGGEWSYTDVLGNTITLPSAPTSMAIEIGVAAALWDFGVRMPTVFGWTASNYPDGDHIAWGRIPADDVTIVSNTEGNVELEQLAAQQPDLIVTWIWDKTAPETSMSGIPAEVAAQVAQIAPIVVLRQGDANAVELGHMEDFAASLGIDLDGEDLAAARTAYEDKIAEVESVAAEQRDITVLFGSFGEADAIYIASPDFVADLGQVRDLGITLANDGSPDATTYWETLSPEQALKYPSDVIYIDQYGAAKTLDDLRTLPTVAQHPAVAAGQVGPWKRDLPISYQGLTEFLETVLVPLRTATKVS